MTARDYYKLIYLVKPYTPHYTNRVNQIYTQMSTALAKKINSYKGFSAKRIAKAINAYNDNWNEIVLLERRDLGKKSALPFDLFKDLFLKDYEKVLPASVKKYL